MPAPSEFSDNTTIVGGPGSVPNGKHAKPTEAFGGTKKSSPVNLELLTSADEYLDEERPFLVKIGKDGLPAALRRLNDQLEHSKEGKILSSKVPTDWIGKEVTPGHVGFINHGGMPK
ncbi:hypothetical protein OF83DRAFT_1176625, partial [Amylostereum chailletii]